MSDVEWDASEVNRRIWEFERDHPNSQLWRVPTYEGNLACALWLLEPEAPMSGIEESWSLDELEESQIAEVAALGIRHCSEFVGSRLAIAQLDLPLLEYVGEHWRVGHFIEKDQVRSRRNMPRGSLLLLREIIAQGSKSEL